MLVFKTNEIIALLRIMLILTHSDESKGGGGSCICLLIHDFFLIKCPSKEEISKCKPSGTFSASAK